MRPPAATHDQVACPSCSGADGAPMPGVRVRACSLGLPATNPDRASHARTHRNPRAGKQQQQEASSTNVLRASVQKIVPLLRAQTGCVVAQARSRRWRMRERASSQKLLIGGMRLQVVSTRSSMSPAEHIPTSLEAAPESRLDLYMLVMLFSRSDHPPIFAPEVASEVLPVGIDAGHESSRLRSR